MSNKKTFNLEDKTYFVTKPRAEEELEAKKYFNAGFQAALKQGALFRLSLQKHLEEQGLWGPDKEKELLAHKKVIFEGLKTLNKGKIKLKDAKKIALEVFETRRKIQVLLEDVNNMDSVTAEAQGDQEKFNYLISACTYDENDNKVFSSVQDYINRSEQPLGRAAAVAFASHYYGLDADFEKTLPEIQFLMKFKFVNDNLEFVNEKGEKVDKDGKKLETSVETDSGEEESGPFLDDDGTEIKV